MTDRRTFLKRGSLAAVGLLGVPRWMRIMEPAALGGADRVRDLALRAIDAAKQAGATYAEARLTRKLSESFVGASLNGQSEEYGLAVRALVNGYWGFAASPYWNADDAVDLARNAVSQAKAYARGRPRTVEWSPIPIANGTWATPVRLDPFTIPIEEKADHFASWISLAHQYHPHGRTGGTDIWFTRTERAVATTEGAYFTQTLYISGGKFDFVVDERLANGDPVNGYSSAEGLLPAGAGWERILDANVPDQIPALFDRAEAQLREERQSPKPGDVGRYSIVCDASTIANILINTIGAGTQLDRALGYEANAGMTSYLGPDPMAFLGTPIASSLVTVRGDRSVPMGLATVQWDTEGVSPEPFTIVDHGTLVNYQTTREQAAWLAPWYAKRGMPVRSNGCAEVESALFTPMQHLPNLSLSPGHESVSFDDLVASTPRGLAITKGSAEPNFNGGQSLMTHFRCREIVNGKLGQPITGIVPLFGSVDFWKHVVALGGPSSVVQSATLGVEKGEPSQRAPFSVRTVPAKIDNVAFINGARAQSQ